MPRRSTSRGAGVLILLAVAWAKCHGNAHRFGNPGIKRGPFRFAVQKI
jgi:hypothetical protein